jgi:hypothetical protein
LIVATPWDGELFVGSVEATVVRAEVIYDGDSVAGEPGYGRRVPTTTDDAPRQRLPTRVDWRQTRILAGGSHDRSSRSAASNCTNVSDLEECDRFATSILSDCKSIYSPIRKPVACECSSTSSS